MIAYGFTNRDGSGRVNPHRRKRDPAQNHAIAGSIPKDRTWRKEPLYDDQFTLIAESFGLTPEEMVRKLRIERGLRQLAAKFNR